MFSVAAGLDRSEIASIGLGLVAISLVVRLVQECAAATFTLLSAVDDGVGKRAFTLRPLKQPSEVGET
jgi:hypothetical protein